MKGPGSVQDSVSAVFVKQIESMKLKSKQFYVCSSLSFHNLQMPFLFSHNMPFPIATMYLSPGRTNNGTILIECAIT